MHNLRLILVLMLLLSGGSTDYVFSSEIIQNHLDKGEDALLSEDIQELSPSRISSSFDFFKERFKHSSPAILSEENCQEISRDIAYISESRFIEPGLSLPDIIFPFHTFL